jgi:hypothetical protein
MNEDATKKIMREADDTAGGAVSGVRNSPTGTDSSEGFVMLFDGLRSYQLRDSREQYRETCTPMHK